MLHYSFEKQVTVSEAHFSWGFVLEGDVGLVAETAVAENDSFQLFHCDDARCHCINGHGGELASSTLRSYPPSHHDDDHLRDCSNCHFAEVARKKSPRHQKQGALVSWDHSQFVSISLLHPAYVVFHPVPWEEE
jgi:hypothetical protein